MNPSSENHFHVRTEGFPERCEICHQADLFDPESGICKRCQPTQPVSVIQLDPHSPAFSSRIQRILATELVSGEQLLWVGKPPLWSKERVKDYLALVAFILIATLLIAPHPFAFEGIFLFCGVCLIYDLWLRSRITYAVTNRRVLIHQEGLLLKRSRSYFRRTLKIVHRAQSSKKAGSIYFEETAISIRNEESYIRIGFENIADYEKVEHLIRTYLLSEKQTWQKPGGLS